MYEMLIGESERFMLVFFFYLDCYGSPTCEQNAADVVCVYRIPTLLLRDSSGDVQEGDELEGNTDFPTRGSHFREGKRSYSQVRFALLVL